MFEKLATLWREKNPADEGVMLTHNYMPMVSAMDELEAAMKTAAA